MFKLEAEGENCDYIKTKLNFAKKLLNSELL